MCSIPIVETELFVLCFAARDTRLDVVLVDTAGRMQDNEPLMRALAKVNLSLSLGQHFCQKCSHKICNINTEVN
jgi:hypothetical protein